MNSAKFVAADKVGTPRHLSLRTIFPTMPFVICLAFGTEAASVLALPPQPVPSNVSGSWYNDANERGDLPLRISIQTRDGVLLVYDAAGPVISSSSRTPSLGPAGYLAYWNDYFTEQLYVYERVLYTPSDVGQALRNLGIDLGIDITVLFTVEAKLDEAVMEAEAEGIDRTAWRIGTNGAIRSLLGVASEAQPVSEVAKALAVKCPIVITTGIEPGQPILPVLWIPPVPARGVSVNDLIDAALALTACPGPCAENPRPVLRGQRSVLWES